METIKLVDYAGRYIKMESPNCLINMGIDEAIKWFESIGETVVCHCERQTSNGGYHLYVTASGRKVSSNGYVSA